MTLNIRLSKLLREPLIHFLLIGLALFLVFKIAGGEESQSPDEIVVSQGAIESLAMSWEKTWQRPPMPHEMEGLIKSYIKQEVLYREALAMGLEKDDTIIKRRLGQKMTFLFEDVADQSEVTDEQLTQYLTGNEETYRIDPQFTFSHVYLNPDKRGENLEEDARLLLAELQGSQGTGGEAPYGDSLMLPASFESLPAREADRQFGTGFAAQLAELSTGEWTGPVRSGFGVHLVFIEEKLEGRVPNLEEVRGAVERDLIAQRRREANEKIYQRLRERYTVTIERPEPVAEKEGKGTAL
jgi:hypothetical protein